MRISKVSLHWAVIALFIGFALGMLTERWYAGENFRPPIMDAKGRARMLERFSRELHLNADQKNRVRAIFEKKRPEFMAIHEEMHEKMLTLRNSAQAEIRQFLTPEQQKRLDGLNEKMDARYREAKDDPGSGAAKTAPV